MDSGVPEQINGKWVGFTDFSEFPLQGPGALPAGLTIFGGGAPNVPTVFEVVDDVAEGRTLRMSGQDTSGWGIGYNAFAGLTQYGEALARVWIPDLIGNRRGIGPCFGLGGLTQALLTINCGVLFRRTGIDFEAGVGFQQTGGAGSGANSVDWREAETSGVWIWIRYQRWEGNPATSDEALIKIWTGLLTDEPLGWDNLVLSFGPGPRANMALGWGTQAVGDNAQQRIAFFAFSEDPGVNATPNGSSGGPVSGDIVAPTVTVDPLQDRWVGLEGTAFTRVP